MLRPYTHAVLSAPASDSTGRNDSTLEHAITGQTRRPTVAARAARPAIASPAARSPGYASSLRV